MGIFVGLSYREQLMKKFGEPLVSELEQITASITEALKNVVKTGQTSPGDTFIEEIQNSIELAAIFRLLGSTTTHAETGANNDETTLWETTVPADSITTDGQVLRITAFGNFGNNNTNKKLRFYWNGTEIVNSNQTWQDRGWQMYVSIMRDGATSQKGHIVFIPGIVGTSATPGEYFTGSGDWGQDITFKITGENSTSLAGDHTFEGGYFERSATATDALNLSSTDVTGTLPVSKGGTGASSLTDGGLLVGGGTNPVTALGVASNGQIPIGDGTTAPTLATLTGTANEVEVTNGAGSITVGVPDAPTFTGPVKSTGMTDNRLVYSDTTGAFTSAGFLYWDDANKRLGHGTVIPAVDLHIFSSNTSAVTFRCEKSGGANFDFASGDTSVQLTASTGDLQLQSGSGQLRILNSLNIEEQAASDTTTLVTFGQVWVKSDAPNELMFTDDAGNDAQVVVCSDTAAANNELAVFTDDHDVEGDSNLTWTGTVFRIEKDQANPEINMFSFKTTASQGVIRLRKARGTQASPTVVASGDACGQITFQGYDGTTYQNVASVAGNIDGTPGSGDMPGRFRFLTTADGATSLTEALRINHQQNVFIGNAEAYPTAGSKTLIIGHGTVPSSMGTNTCGVYGEDDGSGTVRPYGILEDGSTGPLGVVVVKTTTGDPTGHEGLLEINTFDNVFKVYAEGAWRTLTTWL